jgi:chemotaxis protein MotB
MAAQRMSDAFNGSVGHNAHPEIIIIKRKKVSHDGHHGGAWKIAYADFVTAMMAFFLVMWLINASNEETKAAVASYFNPVKLMDTTSNPKGIKDAQYGASSKDSPSDVPKARSDARAAQGEKRAATDIDDTVFRDPYAVLTEIAGGAGKADGGDVSDVPVADDSMPRPGLLGGEAYRDPFEPEFWATQKNEAVPVTKPVEPVEPQPIAQATPDPTQPIEKPDAPKPEEIIANEIKEALGQSGSEAPQLSVVAGNGGVTVNLTDGADFSMFEIGSARPKREVIELVARIATILNSKPGMIEIAGHTDARPFKSDAYDNWRLSSARAQMAYYMLVRAGVSPERFNAIIGNGAAKPRIANDPLAPENRRIEITLLTPDTATSLNSKTLSTADRP